MGISATQAATVGGCIFKQKLLGHRRYPLVLMLEPLFRCNLACAGCGKIQHPEEILKRMLTPQQCFDALEECGAPVVSIAGGEPLIHPRIQEIVDGFVARKKFVYLCTNALLLERKLGLFTPSEYLSFSVHLDGLKARHDACVNRAGVFDIAVSAIREAKARGFRVTVNTTVFQGHRPDELHQFFDEVMGLGVDGMILSPGFSYEKAPQQGAFLAREKTRELFRAALAPMREGKKKWVFNLSPMFLEFLEGKVDYGCTPWGSPNYSVLGWQRPCYLMSEGGYASSFAELMETTDWDRYGVGKNPRCAQCMVSCGYEPTAVSDSVSSLSKMAHTLRASL